MHLLLVSPSVPLSELFAKSKNKLEVIVTFLAILELIKMKEVIACQTGLFQEILIWRNKDNIIPYERRDKTDAA